MPRAATAQQLELEALPAEAPATPPRPSRRPPRKRPTGTATTSEKSGAAVAPSRITASRPSSAQLLQTPGALLTRSHLRQLGLERRAIDAIFRALPVVALPGDSRPMVRVEQYLELVEDHTYRDDRVRPSLA